MGDNKKHVVITGGTRGIGLGLAENFLGRGCNVTISGLDKSRLKDALINLKNQFPDSKIAGFISDVTKREEVEKLYTAAEADNGPVDIWINNAGRGQDIEYAWDLDPDQYENIISTNITGMIHGSLTAMSRMIKQGKGSIYNMEGFGSDGMLQTRIAVYGTTKRAVRYFSRALSKEAAGTAVLVGTISPGMVVTDFIKKPLGKKSLKEQESTAKIFNILADKVETVTPFLVSRMLANNRNGAQIEWLTKPKVLWRFLSSSIIKRDVFSLNGIQ